MEKLNKTTIMGAIIGDIIGSRLEFTPIKSKEFELFIPNKYFRSNGNHPVVYFTINSSRFTDDSVMTLAIAKAFLKSKKDYSNLKELTIKYMQEFGKKHPFAGYGGHFNRWLRLPNPEPYNSYGNGSAMRISSVAHIAKDIDEVKRLSKIVTEVSHNHPEGIKGAEVTAVCTFMALHGCSKEEIKQEAEKYYSLDFNYDDLLKNYSFDVSCQGSVPQSIYAFLISNSYEETIRTVVSMGGDCDTMGAIAGAIAGAYYGIPDHLITEAKTFLTQDLLEIVEEFDNKKI